MLKCGSLNCTNKAIPLAFTVMWTEWCSQNSVLIQFVQIPDSVLQREEGTSKSQQYLNASIFLKSANAHIWSFLLCSNYQTLHETLYNKKNIPGMLCKMCSTHWAWWLIFWMSAFKKRYLKDHKLEVSVSHIVRPCINNRTQQKGLYVQYLLIFSF